MRSRCCAVLNCVTAGCGPVKTAPHTVTAPYYSKLLDFKGPIPYRYRPSRGFALFWESNHAVFGADFKCFRIDGGVQSLILCKQQQQHCCSIYILLLLLLVYIYPWVRYVPHGSTARTVRCGFVKEALKGKIERCGAVHSAVKPHRIAPSG